jgi:hypothetical protein
MNLRAFGQAEGDGVVGGGVAGVQGGDDVDLLGQLGRWWTRPR